MCQDGGTDRTFEVELPTKLKARRMSKRWLASFPAKAFEKIKYTYIVLHELGGLGSESEVTRNYFSGQRSSTVIARLLSHVRRLSGYIVLSCLMEPAPPLP
jgi:hypothetical protein